MLKTEITFRGRAIYIDCDEQRTVDMFNSYMCRISHDKDTKNEDFYKEKAKKFCESV